eukprot:TRINITY_DN8749_c0_g1_i1.p1 TRINITY_DN8749_c0_g1~~TRINITY_DN8749_c0_g1_i1.p1  ORF type:complete len:603 (-),score=90.00 TRINITY_DN8749_c0_g1_i1:135-1700(-)
MDPPHRFTLADLETVAMNGLATIFCPRDERQQPLSLVTIAPDVAIAIIGDSDDIKQLDFSDIEIGDRLGAGSFSVVFKGTAQGRIYAVKRFTVPTDWMFSTPQTGQTDLFQAFRKELRMISGINHQNIVRVEAFCLKPLAILMEFMELGSLYHYLRKPDVQIDWLFRLKVASDVSAGMAFLHNRNPPIVHRDLKSPNILLTCSGHSNSGIPVIVAKIADFGTSRSLTLVPGLTSNTTDNPTWIAPEVLMGKEFTEKSDVYSFGVVLYEILTKKGYFEEIPYMWAVQEAVVRGDRPKIPEDSPPIYTELVEACWKDDPNARPPFNAVFNKLAAIQTKMHITFPQPVQESVNIEKQSDGDQSDDESDDAYDEDGEDGDDDGDDLMSPRAGAPPSLHSLTSLLSKLNKSESPQDSTLKPARAGSSTAVTIPLLNLGNSNLISSSSSIQVATTSSGPVSVMSRINALQQRFHRKNRFASSEFNMPNIYAKAKDSTSPETSPEPIRRCSSDSSQNTTKPDSPSQSL